MSGPWGCPADGTPLVADGDARRCPSCDARYAVRDGVVLLGPGSEAPAPRRLRDLAAALDGDGARDVDAALEAFCRSAGCRRAPHGADWKLVLPAGRGACVLEIGPGAGDVAADLAARGADVAVLAAHPTAAAIVRRRVAGCGPGDVAVAATPTLVRLPCPDGAFDAVAVDEAGLRGFGLRRGGLERLAGELRRVAAPGATVLVGQSNPLWRLPGAARLLDRVRAAGERSLDGVVREASIDPRTGRWGRRALVAAMAGAGFAAPRIFAPIPHAERPEAVLPADEPAVVRYFLDHLVRRNAPATRAALALLRPIVRAGLFPAVVPYWYLVFRVAATRGEAAG